MAYVETKISSHYPMSFSAENIVTRLQPLMIVSSGAAGFVAEQVNEVWPPGVLKNEEGTPININYIALLALAIKNIQELNEKVTKMEMELLISGHDDTTNAKNLR